MQGHWWSSGILPVMLKFMCSEVCVASTSDHMHEMGEEIHIVICITVQVIEC